MQCGGGWGCEGGSAAVLTTARLIHPEHAELLCFTGFKSSLETDCIHDFD